MAGIVEVIENDAIIKSAQDDRLYRGLVLGNGMKIMLISDSTADKAAAALDVKAGSLSDPGDLPGLAHFLEHMLFLGTEKYPSENEYAKFLNEHGGSCNAWTSGEDTNYQFDVQPEHLEGALDRFAQFFLAPLFTESATDREVNAVNSENLKNLQVDGWRLHQLDKSTSDPSHVYSKFGTGNKMTLDEIPKSKGINVREELLKFHDKHYSANLMGLAVLGKDSLDDLQTMTLNLFKDVVNKNLVAASWHKNPFGPEQVQKRMEVVPIKDTRSLHVQWPIPYQRDLYKSKPGHYLSHLIGHEGPGSILSELKAKGWTNSLSAGDSSAGNGFSFFEVSCDLSEEGIEHTDEIVCLIFQYIQMLRANKPQQWIFEECKNLDDMHFRFKDKEKPFNYTSKLAESLLRYPIREVLSARSVCSEFSPEGIDAMLQCLTPQNVRVTIVGKKFSGKTESKEKWYGTEYTLSSIPAETLKLWSGLDVNSKLTLPMVNDFIPTNFDLATLDTKAEELPEMIKNEDFTRIWYKQDNTFKLPKVYLTCEIQSPFAYQDPESVTCSQLATELFRDSLNEYAYAAELCGLGYSLNSGRYGLLLSVKGYSHKLGVLLEKVLEKLVNFKVDPQRFAILKENYARSLRNFHMEQPYRHAIYRTSMLMSEVFWSNEELQDSLDDLTLEAVEQFLPRLLSRVKLEALVYGNCTRETAEDLVSMIEKSLQGKSHSRPLPESRQRRFREYKLPDGGAFEYEVENEIHPNTCTHLYLQSGEQSTHTNILLDLICQIISESCFDVLRTKEQLGYIVFSGARRHDGVQGLRILVQSDREPAYVETRIEAFLQHALSELESLEDDVYKRHVEALAACRLEKPKKMKEQNSVYYEEISTRQYCFDRDNIEVAELRKLTKADVIDFYKMHISHDSKLRHKLSVHVTSTPLRERGKPESAPDLSQDAPELLPAPSLLHQVNSISNVSDFKGTLGLFPLPRPFIPVPTGEKARAKL